VERKNIIAGISAGAAGILEQEMDDPTLPDDMTAKQALELEMRGRIKLTPSQFRAAKELLPYENPKLSAVMSAQMDQKSFAAQLERALARSSAPYVPRPALLSPPEQHSREELKQPFVLRRRNFR
jgi:hypothetical protein